MFAQMLLFGNGLSDAGLALWHIPLTLSLTLAHCSSYRARAAALGHVCTQEMLFTSGAAFLTMISVCLFADGIHDAKIDYEHGTNVQSACNLNYSLYVSACIAAQ